jgi:branched-chain amino acid transport system permease protein
VLGPIQGLLFTGLVLVFMFFRPQGLIPAKDIWRAAPAAKAGGSR